MTNIEILDIRNVKVDGRAVGALVNAFQEAKDPVAIQLALEAYCDTILASRQSLSTALASSTAEFKDYKAKALATAQAIVAECQNPEADANLTVPAIVAEATKSDRDKAIAAAEAKRDAAQAEIDALAGE